MQKVTVESSVDAAGASDNDADDTSKENIVGKYMHMCILLYHKMYMCVCMHMYIM